MLNKKVFFGQFPGVEYGIHQGLRPGALLEQYRPLILAGLQGSAIEQIAGGPADGGENDCQGNLPGKAPPVATHERPE